ncbi:MAG: nuclear transport factor 2 family protein [Blastocatellia bacterium]
MSEPDRMEEQNVPLIKNLYESYVNHDLRPVLESCAEDTEWLATGPVGRLPYAGLYRGPTEVERYLAILDDSEESNHLVPKEFIGHDDRVIVFGEYIARVNATGIQFRTDFVHVFSIREGKIVRFRDFYDTAAALAAYHPPQPG